MSEQPTAKEDEAGDPAFGRRTNLGIMMPRTAREARRHSGGEIVDQKFANKLAGDVLDEVLT